MIIDLHKFINEERESWERLEAILDELEKNPARRLVLQEIKEFHYLYERVSADLVKLTSTVAERDLRAYLERLVARAYGEIHETREQAHRLRPLEWFLVVFPNTFRKYVRYFYLSLAVTIAGCVFGGGAIALDPQSKQVLMPFEHLLGSPKERVDKEETVGFDHLRGQKVQGAAWYMTHNTKVSILTMAMGVTWGIGTIILLLTNGIMLGAVCADYILSGQSVFLLGWLLPHGSVEIPAILLAGQAGLIIAGAVIGWGNRVSLKLRLRAVTVDLVTLITGVALMLIWAGIIEAFLSQYHKPVFPYELKIAFGCIQLIVLTVYLSRSGRRQSKHDAGDAGPAKADEDGAEI